MSKKQQEDQDNTWFKRFMRMPAPCSERREKIKLWVGIIIGIALIVLAVYITGCKGECIRECRSTMESCFDNVKVSEEREQCMTNNAACVKGCNESGTRINWEIKEKKDPLTDTMDEKQKIKSAPPKDLEKPSNDLDDEGFEE